MPSIDSLDIVSHPELSKRRRSGAVAGSIILATLFSAYGSVAAMYDPWPFFALTLLVIGIALAARKPAVATVVLVATYPMLDLTPWAGQWALRHHDYLILGICSGYWIYRDRQGIEWPPVKSIRLQLAIGWMIWAFLSAVYGYLFLANHGTVGAIVQLAPENALRVSKGVLLAAAVAISYPNSRTQTNKSTSLLHAMSLGAPVALIYIGIWCVIERTLFFGWSSLDPSYRTAGPMTGASNLGGQAFEITVILLMALAVSGWRDCTSFGRTKKTLVVLGLLAGTIAILLTLTRSAIATLILATLITVILTSVRSNTAKRRRRFVAAGTAIGILVLIGIVSLPALRQRIRDLPSAWRARLDLYRTSQRAAVANGHSWLWGTGSGTFPTVYTNYQLSRHPPSAPAYFATQRSREGIFLVARGGAPCYLGTQIDRQVALQAERVRMLVRSRAPVGVTVYLCEKNLFTSVGCRTASLRIPAETTIAYGEWRWIDAKLISKTKTPLQQADQHPARPLNLSIGNPPGGYQLAIAGLQLIGPENQVIWQDRKFSSGAKSWLMTTDHYDPFHVENLYLHLWIEQGLIGLMLLSLVSAVSIRTFWRQQSEGAAALIVLVLTMLIAGVVNSPIDTPEPTFIWAVCVFAALVPVPMSRSQPRSSPSIPAHHLDAPVRRPSRETVAT